MSDITFQTKDGPVTHEANRVVSMLYDTPSNCIVVFQNGDKIFVRDTFDNTIDRIRAAADD